MKSNSINNIRILTLTALLIAFAIIIPIQFGFLRIIIPPFSATLASHVPMFVAMFLGPGAAAVVGIGSVIGFLIGGLPLVIVARASSHIVVGIIGAILIKKKVPFPLVAIITAPIHAILEGLIVIPFLGFNYMVYVVAGGTLIHHLVDALIAFGLVKALVKAKSFDLIHSKRAA